MNPMKGTTNARRVGRTGVIAGLLLVAVWGHPAPATLVVWDGSEGDGDFTNALNWVGDVAPRNTDYQDTAIFNATATPSTVNLPSARSIVGLDFQTAGWTLTGASWSNLRTLSSAGTGTNIVNYLNAFADATWTVQSGNTLVLATGFYERNKNITLTGGGELISTAAVGGYSGTVGAWGLHLLDATYRVDAANPYNTGCAGAVFLDHLLATLQLRTSVAGAQALIGSRIVDGVGSGLQVEDIGGGYVEITTVPEPVSSALMLGAASLLLFFRRRLGSA